MCAKMDTESLNFMSVEEECRFWKEREKICKNNLICVKKDFDDFIELSKQMESEMDAALNQRNRQINELISQMDDENDLLKQKLASQKIELNNFCIKVEISEKEKQCMKEYIRNLEQKNDDLERLHRTLNESLNDMSESLERAYEKNVLLENELNEKEDTLEEKIQRLMDEMRNLKLECNVQLKRVRSQCVNNSKVIQSNRRHYHHYNDKVYVQKKKKKVCQSDETHQNILEIIDRMISNLNNIEMDLEAYRNATSSD